MIIRIRTISVALALCASTLGPALHAQTVREVNAPTPPPAAEDDSLRKPDLPTVPEAMQARVTALGATVDRTSECFVQYGERADHPSDPRCSRWYAQLMRAGVAGVHAIGEVLDGQNVDRDGYESVRGTFSGEQRGPRLVQIMVASRAPEAAPYLLRYLAESVASGHDFGRVDDEIVRQLPRLAGHDPAPVAPWERDALSTAGARRRTVEVWLRWWRSHQDETPAQWAADGEARAVNDLASDAPAVRFAAMQRLVTVAPQRAAVTAALQDLLARPELPARAAVYLRRWAQRSRVSVAPATLAGR